MDIVEPSYVQLRYPPNFVFAEHASYPDGRPYTGTVRVTFDVGDWEGSFKDGIRHGWFSVNWGDRVSRRFRYEHGVEVKPAIADESGARGDA
jgi:hypothetical protein